MNTTTAGLVTLCLGMLFAGGCANDASTRDPDIDFARVTIDGRSVEYRPYKSGDWLSGIWFVPSKVVYVRSLNKVVLILDQFGDSLKHDYITITIRSAQPGHYILRENVDDAENNALYRPDTYTSEDSTFRTDSLLQGVMDFTGIDSSTSLWRASGTFSFTASTHGPQPAQTTQITGGRFSGLGVEKE